MYPVTSTGKRTLIKRPVIVTLVRLSWTHNLIINFLFSDAEALEISLSAKLWFLGLDEYRYSWIRFMWTFKTYGINFFFLFLGSCVIRKLLHSSWWELEKKLVWAGGGMGRDHWADSVLFVGVSVCVFMGRRVGWVWHNQASNVALLRSFPLLWNIPCPFLDIFCF